MPVPQRVHHILEAYTFHSCACRRSIACRTKLHVIIRGPPKYDDPIKFSFRSWAMRSHTSSQTWMEKRCSHNECAQMNACMAEKKRNVGQLAHWSYHQTRCKGIQPVNGRPSSLVLYIVCVQFCIMLVPLIVFAFWQQIYRRLTWENWINIVINLSMIYGFSRILAIQFFAKMCPTSNLNVVVGNHFIPKAEHLE